jgi:hypothetical protein
MNPFLLAETSLKKRLWRFSRRSDFDLFLAKRLDCFHFPDGKITCFILPESDLIYQSNPLKILNSLSSGNVKEFA